MLKQKNPWWGVVWKIIAFACYAGINTLARYLSGASTIHIEPALPVNVIIFFQDSFALLFVLPWLLRHDADLYSVCFIKMHFARVMFSLAAIIAWYFALFFIPQAQASALSVFGPILGVLAAKFFLQEHLSWNRFFWIVSSFSIALGVSWPFMPSLSVVDSPYGWGMICVLLSTVLFAGAKLLTRSLARKGESPKKLTAYLLVLMVPFSFISALFFWVTPNLMHFPWLALGGLLTILAIYSVSMALSYAEISFLAPFDCIQFLLNFILGYWVFTEIPSHWVMWLMGCFLLGHLGFLLFHLNRRSQLSIK